MVELILGDCLKELQKLPDHSVDALITDPPYGVNYRSDKGKRFCRISGDTDTQVEFIGLCSRKIKETGCAAIFTRWDVQHKLYEPIEKSGLKVANAIIWDKERHGMGDPRKTFAPSYETIIFARKRLFSFSRGRRPKDIIRVAKVDEGKMIHPTQKPVELMKWLIEHLTRPGDTVLDCYMGSGPAGVAAEQMGRNFVGIEIDSEYYEIAKERIAKCTRDPVQEMMGM